VWLAVFFAWVQKEFLPYCPPEIKEKYQALRRTVLDSAESAWTGQWYLRAWYSDGTPLAGPDTHPPRIDLISQCFAVLGGAPRHHARAALAAAVDKLYDREAGIVKLLDPPFTPEENAGYIGAYLPGVRENGGQYTHAAVWLARACFRRGRWEDGAALLEDIALAAREMAYGAEPWVLAADVYAPPGPEGRAGWSWYTGAAGWWYRTAWEDMLGFTLHRGKAAFSLPPRAAELGWRVSDRRSGETPSFPPESGK
jgi:cellobiose phosphorylase